MTNQIMAYLNQGISKTEKRLGEVEAKLSELDKERDDLQADLDAMKRLRAKEAPNNEPIPAANQLSSIQTIDWPNIGFRDAIRAVLNNGPATGLRPTEVATTLTIRGFKPGGATDINTRVATELGRMAKQGHLTKRGTRYKSKIG